MPVVRDACSARQINLIYCLLENGKLLSEDFQLKGLENLLHENAHVSVVVLAFGKLMEKTMYVDSERFSIIDRRIIIIVFSFHFSTLRKLKIL